jgi:hypothetical protein
LADRAQDILQNAFCILHHVIIPVSHNKVTHRFQRRSSDVVSLSVLVVLSAVDFDDQLPVCTEEIDDVSVDGYLSLEFQSSKSAVSQTKPQQPLGIRLIATQSPRETWVSFRHLTPLTPTLSPAGRGSAPSAGHGFGLY